MIDKILLFKQFLNILNWTRLIQYLVLLAVIAFAWAVYENKDSIYNFVTNAKLPGVAPVVEKVSSKTAHELKAVVDKSDLITAIQIVSVDFQQNKRFPIYTYTDNKELESMYKEFIKSSVGDLPLFTDNVTNNKNIVDLIYGEYACYPYKQTFGYKFLPSAEKHISTVCSHGIPPFYGRFSGIVVIYLTREPTPEEYFQVRSIAKELSTKVYEKDFK